MALSSAWALQRWLRQMSTGSRPQAERELADMGRSHHCKADAGKDAIGILPDQTMTSAT